MNMTNGFVVLMVGLLVAPSDADSWFGRAADFVSQAFKGAGDMAKGYNDMREANYVGSDKYFHARANHEAANRGPGGKWAAKVISNGRESWQGDVSGRGAEDTRADQEANKWGRNGGDPNRYRPKGLPKSTNKSVKLPIFKNNNNNTGVLYSAKKYD